MGKLRWRLLPPDGASAVVEVLDHGARKHGHDGVRALPWLDRYDSAMRHLTAWRNRIDCDAESGYAHLAHAAAQVLLLLTQTLRRKGEDNRRAVLGSIGSTTLREGDTISFHGSWGGMGCTVEYSYGCELCGRPGTERWTYKSGTHWLCGWGSAACCHRHVSNTEVQRLLAEVRAGTLPMGKVIPRD